MISVLIPVYNYNINDLVSALHKQLTNSKIAFEIICLDDVSNEDIVTSNLKVTQFENTTYLLSESNCGIAITRQKLIEKAIYDWVILLDADVDFPDNNYISNYLNVINTNYDAIFGGFAYKDAPPEIEYRLRWKYGKKCEALSAKRRNKTPYKVTIAANLLIKKSTYKSLKLNLVD